MCQTTLLRYHKKVFMCRRRLPMGCQFSIEIELGRKKATSQTRVVEVKMPIVQSLAKLFVGF